jgi:hypothetical protein
MEVNDKFAVVYSFKIIDGMENVFVNAWTELTNLIYKYEGSYGSRLHKVDENFFIGYAQWPDRETWQLSGEKLPDTASGFRKLMRECCSEIKTEYEMNVVQDLLNDKRYTNIDG